MTIAGASSGRSGIDRRTVKPALLVLALTLVMAVVLPFIDSKTRYREVTRKGDIAELADGITLAPAAGWNLINGALAGHTRSAVGSTATTQLGDGSVTFGVQTAPFAGTPSALLSRVNQISAKLHHDRGNSSATHRYRVTTGQGAVGVGEDFVGVNKAGSVVAFVLRSPAQAAGTTAGQGSAEGVEVVASGPQGQISRRQADIVAMIRSIRTSP
jgi:hypothetical protein